MEIRKPTDQPRKGIKQKKQVSKIAQKRVSKNRTKIIVSLVLLGLLLTGVIYTLRWQKLYINNINVTGINKEYIIDIKDQVDKELDKSIFYILPKRNIILLQSSSLSRTLLKQNTYLESVELKRSGLNTLQVVAVQRVPIFAINNGQGSYEYIDQKGFIYRSQYKDQSTSTVLVNDTIINGIASVSGTPTALSQMTGQQLSEYYFQNLKKSVELFNIKNFTIYAVNLKPLGDAELQITSSGGTIRINLYDDIETSIATFSAARKVEPLRTKLISNRDELEYIDLRFGNKVFYKFNGEQTSKP